MTSLSKERLEVLSTVAGGHHIGAPATRDEERAMAAEILRLRKLFDDAGQGEHNVLALIDHYQLDAMQADERAAQLEAALEEREADMHARIRADYDRTVADCWRDENQRVTAERDDARRRVSELEAAITEAHRALWNAPENELHALNVLGAAIKGRGE